MSKALIIILLMVKAMSSATFSQQSPLPTSHKSWFDSQQKKVWFCLSWLLAMLIVASVVSLSFGPAGWDIRLSVAWFLPDTWHSISTLQLNIISEIRLPRLCLGLLIGAVLAQTGAATQALCRNPLADPSVIGVSSGAAVMAVGMIALGPLLQATLGIKAELMLPYAAFVGALLATLLVYQFAQSEQGVQVTSLILAVSYTHLTLPTIYSV